MPLSQFHPDHTQALQTVLAGPAWQAALECGLVEAARKSQLTPPKTVSVFKLPAAQLRELNQAHVRHMIAAGERDEERLLAALGTWPTAWPEGVPVRLSFLGLNVGFDCDMQPRCIYCNQQATAERMTAADWLALVRSAAPSPGEEGVYVSITGGEPLLMDEGLWGAEGLVRGATESGAACNLNTNALALTPQASLSLVSAGLARVHVSLDTWRPEVQDAIHRRPGRFAEVLRGIHNLQIAKALLGVTHPVIHINCVLTRLNADDFPGFLAFLLEMKPLAEGALSPDFDLHLIPVGGERNADLRLSAEDFQRLFTETWAEANQVWSRYLEERGLPEDQRGPLEAKLPFLSPFHRAQQRGGLDEWAECAAKGEPASLALCRRCYVAPTQAFVLPDGSQFWCGGHATSRPAPVGNVLEGSICGNIKGALPQLRDLPSAYCRTCPGATQAINQSIEAELRGNVRDWIAEAEGKAAEAAPEPAAAGTAFEG